MSDDPELARTRASYDATAALYAGSVGTEISDSIEAELDRSLLEDLASRFSHGGRVADLGCGPGRVAAFLAAKGVEVVGIDLSLGMLEMGRRAHPDLRCALGDLAALPLADRSLDGAVCWYSIIHTEPHRLDATFDEMARVLVADAHVLLAFQAGRGERLHRTDVQGTPVALTSYRHDPEDVTRRLASAGFEVRSCAVRNAELAHESTAQAFVFAQLRSAH
jgi:SAM-dependent methyltransferase